MVYFQRNCKCARFEGSLVCNVLLRNKRNDNNGDSKNGGKNCLERKSKHCTKNEIFHEGFLQ